MNESGKSTRRWETMNESESVTQAHDARGRRRFLGGIIAAIQAAIGGTSGGDGRAGAVAGLARRDASWLPAGG
jgi:hypothetical protein